MDTLLFYLPAGGPLRMKLPPLSTAWMTAAITSNFMQSSFGTRCQLPDGSPVEMFVALKPPDSYDLLLLAGNFNSSLQYSQSSLQAPGNPVMRSLEQLWQEPPAAGVQYLGTIQGHMYTKCFH